MRLRSIKWLFILQAVVLAILVFGSSSGIVQLHYPRVVENEPLLAPLKVQSYSANKLVLEDGRAFEFFWGSKIDDMLKESNYLVDLHYFSGNDVEVYTKRRGFICGNSWMGLIEIPLIADDIPRSHRVLVGFANQLPPSDALSD